MRPDSTKDMQIIRLQAELEAAKLRIRELVEEYGNTTEGRDWTWHDKPDTIARAMLLTHPNKAKQLGEALQNLATATTKNRATS